MGNCRTEPQTDPSLHQIARNKVYKDILLVYGYYRSTLTSNNNKWMHDIPQDIATICCNYLRTQYNHDLHMKYTSHGWRFSRINVDESAELKDTLTILTGESYIAYGEDGHSEQTYNGCCVIPRLTFNNDPHDMDGHAYGIMSMYNFQYHPENRYSHCFNLLYERFDETKSQRIIETKIQEVCDVVHPNDYCYVYCGETNGVIYANNQTKQMYQFKLHEIERLFQQYVMYYKDKDWDSVNNVKKNMDLKLCELTVYPHRNKQSNISLCYMSDIDCLFAMECAGNSKQRNRKCYLYEFATNKWKNVASYPYNCTSNKSFECGLFYDEYNCVIYAVSNSLTASRYDPFQDKWQHILEALETNDYINVLRKPTIWLNNINLLYYAVAAEYKQNSKCIPFDIRYIDLREQNTNWNQCNAPIIETIKNVLPTEYGDWGHSKPAMFFFR